MYDESNWADFSPNDDIILEMEIDELAQGTQEAIPYTYYKIIWLDSNVFEDENIKNLYILKDKGFTGLYPIKTINEFFNYLDKNLTKVNLILITSGSMAEEDDGGPSILKQI